ncbi:zinc finger CCCH domain-containing protein 7B-like isoform X2 [Alosa sapidissima]|uniref:zinc finger CCCH domain-containing protein 7B-like isoform X2 n=1 Tax=Alosa sapidissima TaxID=34773 RepID=UPI001C0919D4|nr:zinc finger CCCH domain-containing protein 7B-like isoform X2 [Alosa sapidissima]
MATMDLERQKRREDIQRALAFIQSSLPFPEPESYEVFLTQLVCNLLDEGNATFREGSWRKAVRHYSEGISVANYAREEALSIPTALLESLYLNRAAANYSVHEYELGLQDCERVLAVEKDSQRALYRKALCLRELGRVREAYDCSTECLLSSPQDTRVNELAQELACKLGLKTRKAYTSSPDDLTPTEGSNGHSAPATEEEGTSNGLDFLSDISSVQLSLGIPIPVSEESSPPPMCAAKTAMFSDSAALSPECVPLSVPISGDMGSCEVLGDELDSLLDACVSTVEQPNLLTIPSHLPVKPSVGLPPAFPAPTTTSPLLPSDLFGSALSQLNSLDAFSGLCPAQAASPRGLDALDALDAPDSMDVLDALDAFSPLGATSHASLGPALVVGGVGLDSLSEFSLPSSKEPHSFLSSLRTPNPPNRYNGQMISKLYLLSRNPLEATHEFIQACPICYVKNGPGVLDYQYHPDQAHDCKRNTLLCRRKNPEDPTWKRVRPRPAYNNFMGPFVLCKEVQERQECKYGENCTFAYHQEEIDVWTQERMGTLIRELLFDPLGSSGGQALSIAQLLHIHAGMFMFLCKECFDSKPRIISRHCKENKTVCSNLTTHHVFDHNKCLVHVEKANGRVRYTKIRPLRLQCQFDVCRYEARCGCQHEDGCPFAHSVIELKCWVLQHSSGTTQEEIVQESKRQWHKQELILKRQKPAYVPAKPVAPANSPPSAGGSAGTSRGRSLNMKMKFVCSQCWRDGVVNEPDKAFKYCLGKARHSWIKEHRVLLVNAFEKWVMVRAPPFSKHHFQKYDICAHVLKQRKCTYPGNCSFAHSQEERDVWTYMKNEGLQDMQQLYDMWLTTSSQSHHPNNTSPHQRTDDKHIAMPTDYADLMSGFHCRLCGKHSNSERQRQQHISTEKHKDRLFKEDEENLDWMYRFPGLHLSLCPRLGGACPDGHACDFAHSEEELEEWHERRAFLRRKLAKARADMLIAPTDFNFGRYNFLLRD